MMKKLIIVFFGLTMFFGFVNVASFAQENDGIVLSINVSKENSNILLFKVENRTDQPIVNRDFNASRKNSVIIKNPQGLVVSNSIYNSRGQILSKSINIPPGSSLQWEFDLNKFFYPTDMPLRWAANEGLYQIYWEFNGLVSDVYIYNYSR